MLTIEPLYPPSIPTLPCLAAVFVRRRCRQPRYPCRVRCVLVRVREWGRVRGARSVQLPQRVDRSGLLHSFVLGRAVRRSGGTEPKPVFGCERRLRGRGDREKRLHYSNYTMIKPPRRSR